MIRTCFAAGIRATVARRGEADGGTVLLKVNQLEKGCRILTQGCDMDGQLAWLPALKGALVEETEANGYIARAVEHHPDLWVIEIEDRDGRHPFEGREL